MSIAFTSRRRQLGADIEPPEAVQASPPPAGRAGAFRIDRATGYGWVTLLFAVWLFQELGRPVAQLFKLPMLATLVLFATWCARDGFARRSVQGTCGMLFWVLMVVHVPLAFNRGGAFIATYPTTVAIAMMLVANRFVDTIERQRLITMALIAPFTFLAIYGATHGGLAPIVFDQNYVGQTMSLCCALCFFSAFATRSTWAKLLYGAISVTAIAAAVAGGSRGAFLGLMAVGGYCWIRSPRKLAALAGVAVLGLALLVIAPESYWAEMSTITDSHDQDSAGYRMELWEIATRQFLDHPIFGVGPGNFVWLAGEYQSMEQLEKWGRSFAGSHVTHSLYFELLAERGLVGVILFGTILVKSLMDIRWVSRQERRYRRSPLGPRLRQARYLALGLEGALLGFMVNSLFLSNLYSSHFWLLNGIIAGLRVATERVVRGAPRNAPRIDHA